MKAVLRSIKPYWLYLIIIGKKTIEVGKSFPKADDWSRDVILYCSKDMKSFNRIPEKDREWMRKYLGKCACWFVCDRINEITADNLVAIYFNNPQESTCLNDLEMRRYADGGNLFLWHISNLKIYDEPKELGEFLCKCNKKHCKGCEDFCDEGETSFRMCGGLKGVTRPPQSWMYCEECDQ